MKPFRDGNELRMHWLKLCDVIRMLGDIAAKVELKHINLEVKIRIQYEEAEITSNQSC